MKSKEERKARRQRILAKIKAFFKNLDDNILPKANELALKFMKAIKSVADNDFFDFITKVIPGEVDDKALVKVRSIADKSIIILGLTGECMAEEDLVKKFACIWSKINSLPKEQQPFAKNSLHALALAEFDDNAEEMAIYLAQAPVDYINDENV
jgi:hypothetical protein